MKNIFYALFLLCLFISNTSLSAEVYVNNSASKEGDGSFLHPYKKADDIPRAIKQAGIGGVIHIYGTDEIYELCDTLILLPKQKFIGESSGPMLEGSIELAEGVTVDNIALINKPNGNAFAIRGHDVGQVTLKSLHIGVADENSSRAFRYGIYFDADAGMDKTKNILIQDSVVLAAGVSEPSIIAVMMGEGYHNVTLKHVIGSAREINLVADNTNSVAGIANFADHSTLWDDEGFATLNGGVKGNVYGLWLTGSSMTVLRNQAMANATVTKIDPDGLQTAGIFYSGKQVKITQSSGVATVVGGDVADTSAGINIQFAQKVTLHYSSFQANGDAPHAVYADNNANVTIEGDDHSVGDVVAGTNGVNQITILNLETTSVILQNGESWRYKNENPVLNR